MTRPMSSKQAIVDITAVVPTQRIVSDDTAARHAEAASTSAATGGAGPRAAGTEAGSRAAELDLSGVAVGLPNLSAVLAEVPGGLGAEVCESFTFAGQHWTAADAKVSGTPIGLQLAMEQRGLGTSDDAFDAPLRRHVS